MFNYPGRNTILCIDDDNGVLACWVTKERCWKDADMTCSLLTLHDRVSQIAAACVIAAVIVDYHRAEINGHKIATEIKRLPPQVPIVTLSSDEEIPEHALNVVDAFLSKNDAPAACCR